MESLSEKPGRKLREFASRNLSPGSREISLRGGGVGEYHCEVCGKTYKRESNLIFHQKTHQDIKPKGGGEKSDMSELTIADVKAVVDDALKNKVLDGKLDGLAKSVEALAEVVMTHQKVTPPPGPPGPKSEKPKEKEGEEGPPHKTGGDYWNCPGCKPALLKAMAVEMEKSPAFTDDVVRTLEPLSIMKDIKANAVKEAESAKKEAEKKTKKEKVFI